MVQTLTWLLKLQARLRLEMLREQCNEQVLHLALSPRYKEHEVMFDIPALTT